MSTSAHLKITARHLERNAYLYVRQSTVRQVFENTESTKRQYALRQRVMALAAEFPALWRDSRTPARERTGCWRCWSRM
ncbi:MAG: hypothetical protein HY904_02855 [Deltaproteobacteria bacterium]|nr:hypothetical protein [Deltaproteobacteria bacterium]